MMNRSEIIEIIGNYFTDKPVKSAYIFGSFARNETNYNDIDLLLELDKGVSLLAFAKMKLDLEDVLNKKVDLISSGGLSSRILPYIEKDKVLVYERN
ncbi:MAG: nucleotidyltransferase family protein [Bacteroidia bacterium]